MLSDPTFYVLVAFCIFFAFAGKPLLKAITSQLDSSISKIGYDIDLAIQQRDQAQQFLNDTKLRYHHALKLSQETLQQAQELSQAWRQESHDKIKMIVEKKSMMAEQRIELIQNMALDQIKSQLADLVIQDLQSLISNQNKTIQALPILKAMKNS